MFQKAERKRAKLRLALDGPSGSGKTMSALLIAKGLANGGKIAMGDSERGSGSLYADLADFDVAALNPPYTPDSYIAIIRGAEKAGYAVLIIDSLSHAWTGEGGVLDMHDKATQGSRGGNSYTAWRDVTPKHNALVDALLGANLHVIVTLRTKTAYDLVDDGKGKKKPVKIGLAPIQRDGMEYEFTAVLDLSVDGHVATAAKDRTRLFDGQNFVPTEQTGRDLLTWLDSGAVQTLPPAAPQQPAPTYPPEVVAARRRLVTLCAELGWDAQTRNEWISDRHPGEEAAAMADPVRLASMIAALEGLAAMLAQHPTAAAEHPEGGPMPAATTEPAATTAPAATTEEDLF